MRGLGDPAMSFRRPGAVEPAVVVPQLTAPEGGRGQPEEIRGTSMTSHGISHGLVNESDCAPDAESDRSESEVTSQDSQKLYMICTFAFFVVVMAQRNVGGSNHLKL